jgi:hypothetical protein
MPELQGQRFFDDDTISPRFALPVADFDDVASVNRKSCWGSRFHPRILRLLIRSKGLVRQKMTTATACKLSPIYQVFPPSGKTGSKFRLECGPPSHSFR